MNVSFAACDLSMCWTTYQDATNALHSGILMDLVPNGSDDNPECIVIRTYVKCIVKQGHRYECKTNLKYQSDKIGNKRKLKELNCSTNGAVYDPTVNVAPMLPVSNPDSDPFMCSYEGTRNYKHCGLFGDPHLRTFNDEFQTCKVEGAWSLINNKHLTVQVTNDPVVTSGAATATSKVIIRATQTSPKLLSDTLDFLPCNCCCFFPRDMNDCKCQLCAIIGRHNDLNVYSA